MGYVEKVPGSFPEKPPKRKAMPRFTLELEESIFVDLAKEHPELISENDKIFKRYLKTESVYV
jgi:hypothetical protein